MGRGSPDISIRLRISASIAGPLGGHSRTLAQATSLSSDPSLGLRCSPSLSELPDTVFRLLILRSSEHLLLRATRPRRS